MGLMRQRRRFEYQSQRNPQTDRIENTHALPSNKINTTTSAVLKSLILTTVSAIEKGQRHRISGCQWWQCLFMPF